MTHKKTHWIGTLFTPIAVLIILVMGVILAFAEWRAERSYERMKR